MSIFRPIIALCIVLYMPIVFYYIVLSCICYCNSMILELNSLHSLHRAVFTFPSASSYSLLPGTRDIDFLQVFAVFTHTYLGIRSKLCVLHILHKPE